MMRAPHLKSDPDSTLAAASTETAFATRQTPDEKEDYQPTCPQETFIVPLLRKELHRSLHDYLPRAGGSVLDVGCGGQPFRRLIESAGCTYTAMDVSPTSGVSVDVVCAIDDQLPEALTARDPFDFILCTEVLEHVGNWASAFSNFERLLAPGGRLLLSCPHFYQLHEEPYDFWRPTPHAIHFHAHASGLQVRDLRSCGSAWDVLGTWATNVQPRAKDNRLRARLSAWTVSRLLKYVFRALESGSLQARVDLDGPLYLSNVAILEKPR
jgi:2-polyprenyl-3-methyl-5-hydroxy-6-metoxy-1,4-benzoquinol methylase